MKYIPLRGKLGIGKFAIVDDEDFDALSTFKWHLSTNGYVVCDIFIQKYPRLRIYLYMHRSIFSVSKGKIVDHFNRNKLDNRRSNLRIGTQVDNMHNIGRHKDNNTGYKGVQRQILAKTYMARIKSNGKQYYLGTYATPEEAAKVYNIAAIKLHGEFASLNQIS